MKNKMFIKQSPFKSFLVSADILMNYLNVWLVNKTIVLFILTWSLTGADVSRPTSAFTVTYWALAYKNALCVCSSVAEAFCSLSNSSIAECTEGVESKNTPN